MGISDQAGRYLRYRMCSKSRFGVHSPFVFDLISELHNGRRKREETAPVERIRKQLERDRRLIRREDHGREPAISYSQGVGEIARKHAIRPVYGRVLFKLVKKYRPARILELGTSLGISTSYLHLGHPEAALVSIEACAETHRLAGENPLLAKKPGVHLLCGRFQDRLDEAISMLGGIDLAFIDGHHREAATIRYFQQIMKAVSNDSILVFDDIHHSDEMERAWAAIIRDERVRVSIDLFSLGLIFFKKELSREAFVLRF